MNAKIKEKVLTYYMPEVIGFDGVADRLQYCLLIYKLLLNIEKYEDEDGSALSFIWDSNDTELPNGLTNCFVVGYKPITDEKDEYISAFVNNSISGSDDEEKGFGVYMDEDRQIVQFTRNVNDMSFNKYGLFNTNVEQLLCAIIERLIPWHIKSTPEIRKEIPGLFLNGSIQQVEDKLEEILEAKGILDEINHKEFEALGRKLFEKKIDDQNRIINENEDRIKRYYRDIATCSSQIREARAFMDAYKSQQLEYESPIKEIIDFCKSNNDISIAEIDSYSKIVKFEIKSILCNTDMDDYYAIVENSSASIYRYLSDYKKKDVKAALDAIFVDKIVKTHVGTGLSLNIWDGHVTSYTPHFAKNNVMPHPHLDSSLTCLGSTATNLIMQYTTQLRFYEAINQLMFSATQFSLADSYVAEKWARYVEEYEAIELPDGTYVNFAGVIEYLKEEGKIDG